MIGQRKVNPDRDLQDLTEALKTTLGDHLTSVILFGSFAGTDFHPDHSDVNVLVMADQSFSMLEKMGPVLKAWAKKGHVLPVLVERRELPSFARAFPIEFLDMQSQHRVLFGDDPLSTLKVDVSLLRAQAEHELALNHLKLRQAFALAGNDEKKIRAVLTDSLPSVLTLFRALLRSEGIELADKVEAAKKMGEKIGFDSALVERLHDLRFRRSTDNLKDLAEHYLLILERTLKALTPSRS
jgi:hypothetical protein